MNKIERILAAVKELSLTVPGELGFAFYDFTTGEACFLQGETPFPTASTIKVYLLAELYRQAGEGLLDLDERIEVNPEEFAPGSGVINMLTAPVSLTLRDHAVLMMRLSDNTSTDVVLQKVTRRSVRDNIFACLGLKETVLGEQQYIRQGDRRRMGYYNTVPTDSSPRDFVTILRALHDGTLLGETLSKEALSHMHPTPKVARIEKYLPMGTEVCRKTGSEPAVTNDVGIVYTEKGDYAIVCLHNARKAAEEPELDKRQKRLRAEKLISKVSEAVYRIYMEE